MVESKNFDIVGVFLSDYGLTGQNVALQILSYLDFSSLQNGLLVCEKWNQFLTKDRTLWLQMLGKTQPVLQYLSNELSNGDEDERKVWQEFFDSLKIKEDIKFDKISSLFTKVTTMFFVIQAWGDENFYKVEGYYLPENFENDFGQNITEEIRPQHGSFFELIHLKLSAIEHAKEENEDLEYDFLMTIDSDDDENDETFESHTLVYDADIRNIQSELLQRIKEEIINFAM
jgi:hypothetical protein